MTQLYANLPIAALIAFLIFIGVRGNRAEDGRPGDWRFTALVCAAFTVWSLYTVAAEGPLGFWPNHTVNAWGNQVWIDLLIAFGIGWSLLVPRARRAGMGIWPWPVLLLCSGSIGLLAMLARCQFLETRQTPA